MATFQGSFRKGSKFTVVRFIRLSSTEVIKPGIDLPNEDYPLKEFHLRSLFKRRRIGIKGSSWTASMLASMSVKRSSPETAKKPKKEVASKDSDTVAKPKPKPTAKGKKGKGSWNPFSD